MITIYTDGCCLGNPGAGGVGIVLFKDGQKQEFSYGEKETTNNRMEMSAAITALQKVADTREKIELYTDSKYLIQGINGWIHGWKRNGWKTASRKPVKNKELWQALDALNGKLDISWHWVKGHADNKWNNRCDELAKEAAEKMQ